MKAQWLKNNAFNLVLYLVILFGVLLRLKGFLINPSFWHDECALGLSIKLKSYGDYFSNLYYDQMAPPFFMVVTKFLSQIFGASDLVLRIFPFVVGCSSLFVFERLCRRVFTHNFVIFFAVLIFALNQQLINYSFEFKPYGVDVFLTLLCLLFFLKFDIKKTDKKAIIAAGGLLAFVPWFSITSCFALAAGVFDLFLKDFKSDLGKKFLFCFPLITSILVYFVFYIIQNYTETNIAGYWAGYFLTFKFGVDLGIFVTVLKYLFFPLKYVLFVLILALWGMIIFYKEKNRFVNISFFTLLFLIFASLSNIYPIFDRLVLFLIPIILLWVVKPLDIISLNHKAKSIFILFFVSLVFYLQIPATAEFLMMKTFSRGEYPRESMEFLVENIKPGDIIFVNNASEIEFKYYFAFYDLKNKVIFENVTGESKEKYLTFLNSLDSGNYWFYLPYDSQQYPVLNWIKGWLKERKVSYSLQKASSMLVYVSF